MKSQNIHDALPLDLRTEAIDDIISAPAVKIERIVSKSDGTEDIFDGRAFRAARRCSPQSIWPIARRNLDQINRIQEINELKVPPGNRLERLKGNRENQYSIRINQQYRICFIWEEGHAYEIEITDYH